MRDTVDLQTSDGEIYLAGQRVSAGNYREIGSRREICLEEEDVLPASLDGRVACYERITATWALHVGSNLADRANHTSARGT